MADVFWSVSAISLIVQIAGAPIVAVQVWMCNPYNFLWEGDVYVILSEL